MGLPTDTPTPKIPRPDAMVPTTNNGSKSLPSSSAKRKANDDDEAMDTSGDEPKKSKIATALPAVSNPTTPAEVARMHAQSAAAYIPFLEVEHLVPPKLPSHEEMEGVLLTLRKKALVDEYFGDENET